MTDPAPQFKSGLPGRLHPVPLLPNLSQEARDSIRLGPPLPRILERQDAGEGDVLVVDTSSEIAGDGNAEQETEVSG